MAHVYSIVKLIHLHRKLTLTALELEMSVKWNIWFWFECYAPRAPQLYAEQSSRCEGKTIFFFVAINKCAPFQANALRHQAEKRVSQTAN